MNRAWIALLIAGCSGGAEDAVLHVRATVSGEVGACKITIEGRDGTPDPSWGDGIAVGEWLGDGTLGIAHRVLAADCDVSIPLPAGAYTVTAARGIEHEAPSRDLVLAAGETNVDLDLGRAFDTRGWACADMHVHSAPSFDSDVPLDQRVVAAVAEGLDVIIPTDHDALGAWDDPLGDIGVGDRLTIVLGNELSPTYWPTPVNVGHANVYPVPSSYVPGPIPGTTTMAEIVDAVRPTLPSSALYQLNHPRLGTEIGAFLELDGTPIERLMTYDDGTPRFEVLEIWNGFEYELGADVLSMVLADWYALLDRGIRVIGAANSDSHKLASNAIGYPRTCVRVDDSGPIDADAFLEGLRNGKAFATSGPFVEIAIGDQGSFDVADASSPIRIDVRVNAPSWAMPDRITLVHDGEAVEERPITSVPANETFELAPIEDGWVLVTVHGPNPPSSRVAGTHLPLAIPTFAFTNPIFLDVDRDGR